MSFLKHGKHNTRIYHIMEKMKDRCHNANSEAYSYYGERGISVCDEWRNNFQSFYRWSIENGYSDELTIDRINNNLGYYPENCRWVTRREQSHNLGMFSTNTSGYKGIYWSKAANKWTAEIISNNKKHYLGLFENIDDAITARKEAETKYWGK